MMWAGLFLLGPSHHCGPVAFIAVVAATAAGTPKTFDSGERACTPTVVK